MSILKYPFISILVALTLVVLLWVATPPAAYAATCTSTGTGNWSAITWSCGHVPITAIDDVVIAAGHTVTLDINATVNNVTTNLTGAFHSGAFTLNVTGNWTNNGLTTPAAGTVNLNGTGGQTITGTVVSNFHTLNIINGGRTVTFTINIRLIASSSWTGDSCGTLLSLRNSISGTARNINDIHNLVMANWLDVQDLKALQGPHHSNK